MIVLLDAGPLGLVTNPNIQDTDVKQCVEWLTILLDKKISVCIPEISYYEVRRELVRAKKLRGLRRLDDLKSAKGIRYLPINTNIVLKATELWAASRQKGHITACDAALDGDVILAATALSLPVGDKAVIATTNTKHLTWFTEAKEWPEITVAYCLESSKDVSLSLKVKRSSKKSH